MNFDKVMSGLAGSGVLGGLAGGAVSGALMGNKQARKTAGTLLKVGGMAALGGMAWKAYQGYQAEQGRAATAAPADPAWKNLSEPGFAIDNEPAAPGSRALLLVQAMIAAAHADGHLDTAERERIMAQVKEGGLTREESALVFDALQQPLGLSQLCAGVDCPELATEVYMASLLAVDANRIEAELYLDALAYRLGLPAALVAQLRAQVPAGSDREVA